MSAIWPVLLGAVAGSVTGYLGSLLRDRRRDRHAFERAQHLVRTEIASNMVHIRAVEEGRLGHGNLGEGWISTEDWKANRGELVHIWKRDPQLWLDLSLCYSDLGRAAAGYASWNESLADRLTSAGERLWDFKL